MRFKKLLLVPLIIMGMFILASCDFNLNTNTTRPNNNGGSQVPPVTEQKPQEEQQEEKPQVNIYNPLGIAGITERTKISYDTYNMSIYFVEKLNEEDIIDHLSRNYKNYGHYLFKDSYRFVDKDWIQKIEFVKDMKCQVKFEVLYAPDWFNYSRECHEVVYIEVVCDLMPIKEEVSLELYYSPKFDVNPTGEDPLKIHRSVLNDDVLFGNSVLYGFTAGGGSRQFTIRSIYSSYDKNDEREIEYKLIGFNRNDNNPRIDENITLEVTDVKTGIVFTKKITVVVTGGYKVKIIRQVDGTKYSESVIDVDKGETVYKPEEYTKTFTDGEYDCVFSHWDKPFTPVYDDNQVYVANFKKVKARYTPTVRFLRSDIGSTLAKPDNYLYRKTKSLGETYTIDELVSKWYSPKFKFLPNESQTELVFKEGPFDYYYNFYSDKECQNEIIKNNMDYWNKTFDENTLEIYTKRRMRKMYVTFTVYFVQSRAGEDPKEKQYTIVANPDDNLQTMINTLVETMKGDYKKKMYFYNVYNMDKSSTPLEKEIRFWETSKLPEIKFDLEKSYQEHRDNTGIPLKIIFWDTDPNR